MKVELLNLCFILVDGDMFCGECNVYFVVCIVVGKKRIFCGCGNEVVVLWVNDCGKLEIECWWNGEDRNEGFVLNIVVIFNFVWILICSSFVIECWDFCKVKLVGYVDCMVIFKDNGYIGDLWGVCVVSFFLLNKIFWVGLGIGYMIFIDLLICKYLSVIWCYMFVVWCFVDICCLVEEILFVLLGVMGFIVRFGYGLIK